MKPRSRGRAGGRGLQVKPLRHRVRVRFGDTDPFGVVYFASYFRYVKEALDEFLRGRGLDPAATYRKPAAGGGLPIAGSSARFLAPARYDDLLEVETSVRAVRRRSATFAFRVRCGETVVAEAEIVCVAVDPSWRPIAIPAAIAAALRGTSRPTPEAGKALSRRRLSR